MSAERPNDGPPSSPDDAAAAAFAAAYADDWRRLLRRKKDGAIIPNLANTVCILENDLAWRGVIAFDEFSGRVVKRAGPPFAVRELGEWTDIDDRRTLLWLAQQYELEPREQIAFNAVQLIADQHRFHEVRDYLNALKWDGKQRVRYWLGAYCGAEIPAGELTLPPGERPTATYLEAAGTKWLLQAIARVMEPGCKADHVLVFEGPQGTGKSTVFAILAGRWFTDAPIRLGDKDSQAVMRGKWIVELAELDALGRAENSQIKAFFSQYVDRYRAHYERRAADIPRQQVFCGTVNHRQWLRDETGGRRFWPVWCADVDLDELRAARDQLWAEAMHLYRAGTPWHVTSNESALFQEQQDARYVGDAWETRIAKGLRQADMDGNIYQRVTTADVLAKCLHLDAGKWTRAEQIRVGVIMQRIGWIRERESAAIDPGRPWVYVRPKDW